MTAAWYEAASTRNFETHKPSGKASVYRLEKLDIAGYRRIIALRSSVMCHLNRFDDVPRHRHESPPLFVGVPNHFPFRVNCRSFHIQSHMITGPETHLQ